jgi:hypothetical protein
LVIIFQAAQCHIVISSYRHLSENPKSYRAGTEPRVHTDELPHTPGSDLMIYVAEGQSGFVCSYTELLDVAVKLRLIGFEVLTAVTENTSFPYWFFMVFLSAWIIPRLCHDRFLRKHPKFIYQSCCVV